MPGAGPPPTTSASLPLGVSDIAGSHWSIRGSVSLQWPATESPGEPLSDGGRVTASCLAGRKKPAYSLAAPRRNVRTASAAAAEALLINRHAFLFSIPYRHPPLTGDAACGPVFRRHSLR